MKIDCAQVERDKLVERGVAEGGLDAETARLFEAHCAACPACAEKLRAARSAQAARRPRPRALWWGLAAAAAIAGLVVWRQLPSHPADTAGGEGAPSAATSSPAPRRHRTMKELTEYSAPVYSPPETADKQAAPPAAFRDAMQFYVNGDYPQASNRLGAVLKKNPDYTPAHFFRGASELLQGHASLSIQEWNEVLTDNASQYHDDARWGFAKAALAKGDVGQARAELAPLAGGASPLAGQAKEVLDDLKSLGK